MAYGDLSLFGPDRDPVRPSKPDHLLLLVELDNIHLAPARQCSQPFRCRLQILKVPELETSPLSDAYVLQSSFLANLVDEARCCCSAETLAHTILNRVNQLRWNEQESFIVCGDYAPFFVNV